MFTVRFIISSTMMVRDEKFPTRALAVAAMKGSGWKPGPKLISEKGERIRVAISVS